MANTRLFDEPLPRQPLHRKIQPNVRGIEAALRIVETHEDIIPVATSLRCLALSIFQSGNESERRSANLSLCSLF